VQKELRPCQGEGGGRAYGLGQRQQVDRTRQHRKTRRRHQPQGFAGLLRSFDSANFVPKTIWMLVFTDTTVQRNCGAKGIEVFLSKNQNLGSLF
jgi:hypothetical protein